MLNSIKKIFENDKSDVSLGIIINMENKTETFIVGNTSSLKTWSENRFPDVLPTNAIRHTNVPGSVIKSINKLMRFKRETDAFLEDYEQLCNIEVYCAENYNAKLNSLASNYEIGDHVNMFLNLIILNVYNKCVSERRKFNDLRNLLKSRVQLMKKAEKHINVLKANTDNHMSILSIQSKRLILLLPESAEHIERSCSVLKPLFLYMIRNMIKSIKLSFQRKMVFQRKPTWKL